jgi:hypothetical protein
MMLIKGGFMAKRVAQIFGMTVLALAVAGFLSGEGHLLGLMNIDKALDILRMPIAAALLYAGFATNDAQKTNSILLGVGVLYIGMGLFGMISPELFGLLPNGLTGFDVAFHLLTGAVGIMAAIAHEPRRASLS